MKFKTVDFQNVCKTIALAVDDYAANLELVTNDNFLYLNVTNKEYYVSVKFPIDGHEDFRAVVDAALFLNLISGINTEFFDITKKDNVILVKTGKSSYKLAMIFENDTLIDLPKIVVYNKTVEMPISIDVLKSILNVNSKEVSKIKSAVTLNEAQKLYYITQNGCFTFSTGACLNGFTLEKPVQLLLNDRLVHLFKLFKNDVKFGFGYDSVGASNIVQSKIVMETDDIYLAAIITNDDTLISRVQGPCTATKQFIEYNYPIKVVVSVNELSAAISRLMLFTKNSIDNVNIKAMMTSIEITNNEFTLIDKLGNSESVTIENGSFVDSDYKFSINLSDLKLVLDSCKDEHITINCGNERTVVITRGTISNVIPEGKRD